MLALREQPSRRPFAQRCSASIPLSLDLPLQLLCDALVVASRSGVPLLRESRAHFTGCLCRRAKRIDSKLRFELGVVADIAVLELSDPIAFVVDHPDNRKAGSHLSKERGSDTLAITTTQHPESRRLLGSAFSGPVSRPAAHGQRHDELAPTDRVGGPSRAARMILSMDLKRSHQGQRDPDRSSGPKRRPVIHRYIHPSSTKSEATLSEPSHDTARKRDTTAPLKSHEPPTM